MYKKLILLLGTLTFLNCAEGDAGDMTGRIAMKGSCPHTYLVLEDVQSKKSVKLSNYKAFGLEKRQNQIVTLNVKFIKKGIGPGFPDVVEVIGLK